MLLPSNSIAFFSYTYNTRVTCKTNLHGKISDYVTCQFQFIILFGTWFNKQLKNKMILHVRIHVVCWSALFVHTKEPDPALNLLFDPKRYLIVQQMYKYTFNVE